jgi:hypothetical protein
MLNVVVFSKDRACQLEALLRSFLRFAPKDFGHLTVVWTASTEEFRKGYQIVNSGYKAANLRFMEENHDRFTFKHCVNSCIDPELPLTMFLVDDILFKDSFDFQDEALKAVYEPGVICVSLRLWEGTNFCYPTQQKIQPPLCKVENNKLEFLWKDAEGDWGYPMSIDGHVFKTDFAKKFVNILEYNNPNSFEGMMAHAANLGFFNHLPKMVSYKSGSKLLNIPANRVQDTARNRHGNLFTAEEMNQEFLSGRRIDIEPFVAYPNSAPHIELPIKLLEDE